MIGICGVEKIKYNLSVSGTGITSILLAEHKSWFTNGLYISNANPSSYTSDNILVDSKAGGKLYIINAASNLTTGKFNPHITLDLNLINYKNKYKYTDYTTSAEIKVNTEFLYNSTLSSTVETLISGSKPVFSNWLTEYTTNLYTKFNTDIITANNQYNNIALANLNDSRLPGIFNNITNYTQKYKKACISLYDT
jgi:hypothetical protein